MCSICMHLQSAPAYTEMHGEVRTPVSQAQRLAMVRGCEARQGIQHQTVWLLPWLSIFIMLLQKGDQQRIRLTWPLKRGDFPRRQPYVAGSNVMVFSVERKEERSQKLMPTLVLQAVGYVHDP